MRKSPLSDPCLAWIQAIQETSLRRKTAHSLHAILQTNLCRIFMWHVLTCSNELVLHYRCILDVSLMYPWCILDSHIIFYQQQIHIIRVRGDVGMSPQQAMRQETWFPIQCHKCPPTGFCNQGAGFEPVSKFSRMAWASKGSYMGLCDQCGKYSSSVHPMRWLRMGCKELPGGQSASYLMV